MTRTNKRLRRDARRVAGVRAWNGLHAWLAQEARRYGRRVSLPAALLLGHGASYAATRAWPVLLGLALRSALHGPRPLAGARA